MSQWLDGEHRTRREIREGDSLVLLALWRAVRVFRVLALVYAVWSVWVRRADMQSFAGALVVLALLGGWTAYLWQSRRQDLRIHLVELVITCAAVLSTRWLDAPQAAFGGETTVPGVWQAVPPTALGLILGWRGGLAASLVVGVAMVLTVGRFDVEPIANAGLLVMLGTCVGYGADVARAEQAAVRRALRKQAEIAERDRLARTVHDGVLQALAFIHRRGLDLGGEAARLGVLAAQQERSLRALATGVPLPELEQALGGPVDLREALKVAVTGTAVLVAPEEPVDLGQRRAQEVTAAVEAALDNVRKHAGPDARAWVLVDDLGSDVVVTVRDNGVGVTEERLAQASGVGRIGVASSIHGRIADLGGRASYLFGPGGGTTVEMWVPKDGG